jgi:hypothetical protein
MAYLGIDPGLEGGWAIYWPHTNELVAGDLPTSGEKTKRQFEAVTFADIIHAHNDLLCAALEQVNADPKWGAGGAFRFAESYGCIRGVLGAVRLPFGQVRARQWKSDAGLPTGASKEDSRQQALRLWPHHAALFSRKKDHGRAEAALIARWLSRNPLNTRGDN